jgi:MICOS complex subunit MIC60
VYTLWSALRAITNAIDSPTTSTSAQRPFCNKLHVLHHAVATRDDTVASVALDALEAGNAPDIGIEPLADLASWFTTSVTPAVSRVTLVPDDDHGSHSVGVMAHLALHVEQLDKLNDMIVQLRVPSTESAGSFLRSAAP